MMAEPENALATTPLGAGGIGRSATRRIAVRLLPFLFILYIVAFLDRMNVGAAALQLPHDLGLSDRAIGLGAGIFFLGYFSLEIPGALIAERWSARRWIARIMVSWGMLTVLMAFIHTGHQFYIVRFLVGAAEAGFFPAVVVYLTHWFRAADRAKAVAGFYGAMPLSYVIGSPLAGVLLGLVGVAILVVPGGLNGTIDPVGTLMLFGATLSWALGTFLSPRLETPRNALVSTAYQMVAGGVALLVVGLGESELAHLHPGAFSVRSLIAFAYLVVFGSLVAFSAYTWLLQNASVSLVSTYAFVNPVVAVVLGTLVLAEPITATIVIGAAIIVVAVAFIIFRQNAARLADRDRVAPAAEAAD